MVSTIDSERTTLSQTNKVPMTISVVACVGALVALIWLAVLTNSLTDTRAKLDTTQAATRTLQTQVYELTQRTQGHESTMNKPQMQSGAPADAAKPMPGMGMMPGMDMPMPQSPQQPAKQQPMPMQQPAQQQQGGAAMPPMGDM